MDLARSRRTAWWIILMLSGVFAVVFGVAFLTVAPIDRITPADFPMLFAGSLFGSMTLTVAAQNTFFRSVAPVPDQLLMQVVSMGALAGGILLPIAAPAGLDPRIAYAGSALLLLGSGLATWRVMRDADELMREVTRKATVAGVMIFQTIFIAYAVGERLGLMGGVSAWTWAGWLTISMLAGSMWVSRQHGLGRLPARGEE